MQLSRTADASRGIRATEWAVLNWIGVRQYLAALRTESGLTVAQLAEAIGVEETTIYRIENVAKNADHKPELPTIIGWLENTKGPTLSSFFAQLERGLTSPDHVIRDTDRATSSEQSGARIHDAGALSPPDAATLAELRAFVSDLAATLAAFAGSYAPEHRPLSGTPLDQPKSGDVSS